MEHPPFAILDPASLHPLHVFRCLNADGPNMSIEVIPDQGLSRRKCREQQKYDGEGGAKPYQTHGFPTEWR
jgi:hypothetical protein